MEDYPEEVLLLTLDKQEGLLVTNEHKNKTAASHASDQGKSLYSVTFKER